MCPLLQVTHDISHLTAADVFRAPGVQTPLITRFSTVIHERGSPETLRDPRGFAVSPLLHLPSILCGWCAGDDMVEGCMPLCRLECGFAGHPIPLLQCHIMQRPEGWWLAVQVKFYTREGNWDLVGNNFPVSFRQLLHIVLAFCTSSYLSGNQLKEALLLLAAGLQRNVERAYASCCKACS